MTEKETTSTTVPRTYQENYMIVLELFHSSTEALADEEEYFDISADSLESNCKRMKLDSCFESLSPGNRHNSSVESLIVQWQKAQKTQTSWKTAMKEMLTTIHEYS